LSLRVLLLEDDLDLGAALSKPIRVAGYDVVWVRRLHDARAQLASQQFDAAILDVNLPDGEGFSLLAELREAQEKIPVIIMTAREKLDDRLHAFGLGADDYVVKPFAVPELLARLAAIIRRAAGHAVDRLQAGAICLSIVDRVVTVNGKLVALTPLEYGLLTRFMLAVGRVLTRGFLMENVWTANEDPTDSSLEVAMHGLRKKLGVDQIKTIRGVGYMLVAE
jgi:two-component system, OmpR family, response regulator QseB